MKDSELRVYGPASWVGHLYNCLENLNLNADALLHQAGLTRTVLQNPDGHVMITSFAKFFETAAAAANDELFGFKFGAGSDPRDLDILWYLGVSSSTLEEAIENAARYSRIRNNYMSLEIKDDSCSNSYPGTCLLDIGTRPFPDQDFRQAEESAIALYLNTIRRWTNTAVRPVEVTFKHIRLSRLNEIERLLGCPVVFGAASLSIRLKAEHMKLPIPTSDDRLLRILQKHGDDLLNEHQTHVASIEHEVMSQIVKTLAKGQANTRIIANDLGVTERTLSRRLADKGTSFSKILTEVRHQLFLKYIEQKELTLTQITHLLGYSEASAMNNAVKRWTGKTPLQLRHNS